MKTNRHGRFKTFLRRYRLKARLLVAFILLAIMPVLIVGSVTYVNSYHESEKRAIEYSQNMVYQVSANVKNLYDEAMNKFRKIVYNATIQNSIVNYRLAADTFSKGIITNRIKDVLSETVGGSVSIESAEVMTTDCDRFVYGFGVTAGTRETSALIGSAHERGALFHQISRNELNYNDNNYLIFGKQLKDQGMFSTGDKTGLTGSSDIIGYAFMSMKLDGIERLRGQSSAGEEQYLVVMDENGKIIAHPDGKLFSESFARETVQKIAALRDEKKNDDTVQMGTRYKNTSGNFEMSINGLDKIIVYDIIPTNNWVILNVISVDDLTKGTRQNGLLTIVVTLISMMAAIACAVAVTSSISEPVDDMLGAMNDVGEGNLEIRVADFEESNDELGLLSARFNDMVEQLRRLIDEVYKSKIKEGELEFLRKEAELNALQQQVNPHFLYNTLESIYWTAQLNGDEEISEMITALGNFFRSSINRGLEFINIEDELKDAKDYIFLQKIRFRDRFNVEWDIDENIFKYKTLKFILQPIIENAIVHGVENLVNGGIIRITGKKLGDTIELCVSDQGVGMSTEELDNLIEYIDNDTFDKRRSIGVKNVHQRIKLYFGEQYGLTIQSQKGKGTSVVIRFMALNSVPDVVDIYH